MAKVKSKVAIRAGLKEALGGLVKVYSAVDYDGQRVNVLDAVNAVNKLRAALLKVPYKPILRLPPQENHTVQ